MYSYLGETGFLASADEKSETGGPRHFGDEDQHWRRSLEKELNTSDSLARKQGQTELVRLQLGKVERRRR